MISTKQPVATTPNRLLTDKIFRQTRVVECGKDFEGGMEMTLVEKLNSICEKDVKPIEDGEANSIEEFWDKFIYPRLPQQNYVEAWHDLLMKYIEESDAVFPIRQSKNINNKKNLTRGLLVEASEGYSYFACDNEHVKYYVRMCHDGYIPTVQELKEAYKSRQFPLTLPRYRTPDIEDIQAFRMTMSHGCDGYYLAHVIDVNKTPYMPSLYEPIKSIDVMNKYELREHIKSKWLKKTDEYGTYFCRDLPRNKDVHDFLVAMFLRYVHPFNYFWVPGDKHTICWIDGEITASTTRVGERPRLTKFVREKFADMYGKRYEEFYEKVMAPYSINLADDGNAGRFYIKYTNQCH